MLYLVVQKWTCVAGVLEVLATREARLYKRQLEWKSVYGKLRHRA